MAYSACREFLFIFILLEFVLCLHLGRFDFFMLMTMLMKRIFG